MIKQGCMLLQSRNKLALTKKEKHQISLMENMKLCINFILDITKHVKQL
jgi:hypothetical protein